MTTLKLTLYLLTVILMASCSPLARSNKAILMDDDGRSMRFVNGKQDKVHKKWKSNTYKAKSKSAKRRR
ncbi:hypothetical protein [Pontibacter ruber]|uniref:Uncharacterized protein n=1 Tax=Pontibacter ruber TaxID=1343895 RepID=A0ABW5D0Y4_9BACT